MVFYHSLPARIEEVRLSGRDAWLTAMWDKCDRISVNVQRGKTGREKTMDIQELLNAKRDEILEVARSHGAYNIRVFGSVARGEADGESDIDILVDLQEGRSLLDHAGLMLDLQDLLGCKVDVATERGLKERIRDRVLGEAKPL